MSIGTTAAIVAGVGAAGSLASGIIGSNAAGTAASQQEQGVQAGIAEQAREFNQTQANEAPWLQAGQGALSFLSQGLQPGGQFMTPADSEVYQTPTYTAPAPYTQAAFTPAAPFAAPAPFTAPTTVDEQNDPGYTARLAAGQQALTRGALASGGAFSGGTMQALQQAGQDYASNEYSNVYNRALTGYQTNFGNALNAYQTNFGNSLNSYNANTTAALNAYNTNAATGLNAWNANTNAGLAGYQTRFNAANTNQANQYNRLAALSGVGQTAVGQLAQAGQAAANNTTSLLAQGGNAAAAGTLGSAGAFNSAIQGTANSYTNGLLLNSIMNGSRSPLQSLPLTDNSFGMGTYQPYVPDYAG